MVIPIFPLTYKTFKRGREFCVQVGMCNRSIHKSVNIMCIEMEFCHKRLLRRVLLYCRTVSIHLRTFSQLALSSLNLMPACTPFPFLPCPVVGLL